MDRTEKSMNIVGIYGWGEGISIANDLKFKTVVEKFGEKQGLEITESQFGVKEHKSDELDIYFHPMETVFRGDKKQVDELFDEFKDRLLSSGLDIKLITVKWEKLNGEYVKEF